MIKKSITYTNLDGKEVTEEHLFHLSKADLIEMQLDKDGGLGEHLQKIVEEQDNREIFKQFKILLAKAYGTKSEDGKRFIKDSVEAAEFLQSEAFSEIAVSLMEDAEHAAVFFNGMTNTPPAKQTPKRSRPANKK